MGAVTRKHVQNTSRYVIHADRFKSLSYEEKPRATKTEVLLEGNLYEQLPFRYYAALFVNISRLFLSGLTCNLAGIVNIEQASSMVTGTFAYTMLNNVTIDYNTDWLHWRKIRSTRCLISCWG